MPDQHRFYTVTELAEELEVTPRAIRFYEVKGLLTPERAGATRVYTHRDRARLLLILRGKRLGFSLAEIKEFLDLYVVDTSQTEQLRLLRKKVHERLEALEVQRRDLEASVEELKDIERLVVDTLTNKGIDPDAIFNEVASPAKGRRPRRAKAAVNED
jgi:DNA-binding transcriptional MerR regulator